MSATVLAWVPGFWEWVAIAVVAVLLFGRRLPEVGRSLGRGVVEFKRGLREVEDEVKASGDEPPPEGTRPSKLPRPSPSPEPPEENQPG
jgi:sec-independent protein translocase protein TatA